MDLNEFLIFLYNAQQHKQTCIESLRPFGFLSHHVVGQFEWTFNWFVSQTTAQYLSWLEITHSYGNTPPVLRLQILYLLNELAQNRINLEEFNNQIDLSNDGECPQIEEIIDGQEEEDDDEANSNSGDRDALNAFQVEEEEPEHLRKLFIKGFHYKTADASVKAHFSQFGTILEFTKARDPSNCRFRGFGFITYSRASMVDAAIQASPHLISGRVVVAKREDPIQRDAFQKRIHLAGLGEDVFGVDLREYFVNYGNVVQVKIFMRKEGKCAFVEFDDYGPVERIVLEKHHLIKGQVIQATRYLLMQKVDSTNREARGSGRNVPIPQFGSSGYNRRGNERYGNDGRYGRNNHQGQGWNHQQPRGQQQQRQVGRDSDYGNSGYGNSTGGGPIQRGRNRRTVGPYRNRI